MKTEHSILALCLHLEVSPSGYYDWQRRRACPGPRAVEDEVRPYLKAPVVCPAGGSSMQDSYRVTDCQSAPTCIAPGGGVGHGHVLQ